MNTKNIIDRSDRYCVIGAGPAGLLAARSLKQAGIAYDQFEKDSDVGGIWDIEKDWTPMYETAHFISSKTVSHLPGYPMPESYPDYPNHAQIFAYIKNFARDFGLYGNITFDCAVEWLDKDGETWLVTLENGETRRYAGLFICNGNTWDPNIPEYPGEFAGETIHSLKYNSPEEFRGKRVLIVGAGNSGCDIACDAAASAKEAYISMRRGYHFIPKHIFGQPSDLFAQGVKIPARLETFVFEKLLKLLIGDLTNYGLPKPDHRVLESHPIMNTQILHFLSHGDLEYRPDIERFEGNAVHFVDGRSVEVDLIVYATGYKVTYPFMQRSHFEWVGKYPELYLSAFHRKYDNVCVLGLHQTDGGAYEFFSLQADMMCNQILAQRRGDGTATEFVSMRHTDRPDLSGGLNYVKSDRHATYVKKAEFKSYAERIIKRFKWRTFGLEAKPEPYVAEVTQTRANNAA